MTLDAAIAALGLVLALQAGTLAGVWRLFTLIIDRDSKQTEHRRQDRTECQRHVQECEQRLTSRIETLERYSYGYRAATAQQNRGGDGI